MELVNLESVSNWFGTAGCQECGNTKTVYELDIKECADAVYLCLDCLHKLYVVLGENKEVNP